jgi:PKD repeat protein
LLVSAATPTEFSVNVTAPSGRNITKYTWDFGDGSDIKITNTNKATHTYSNISGYSVEVEVEDNTGFKSIRKFTIIVGSPQDVVNSTIKIYKQRLNNITTSMNRNWM